MPTILENRRTSLADDLAGIVREAETQMGREDFDPENSDYIALRENRERTESELADVIATINARSLSLTPAPAQRDAHGDISDMRRVLREYDRGNSDRFDIEYQIQRAYQVLTTNPTSGTAMFTPTPTRIQVAELPVITPALDAVRAVATTNTFDFVVPPPPVAAATVPELGLKPAVEFVSTKVSGSLETDAHILDVSRQTLEDDSSAENTLRSWLSDGVRLRQNAKANAAIAGATGTLTATGSDLLSAIRNGKAELSKLGIVATAVTLSPNDASSIDLAIMTNGHTGPEGNSTLFGMTVIENPAIPDGAPLVGALKDAIYFLYRSSISTYITDSGMTVETTPRDRFSHNILGILGEGRSKAFVVQPKLLVKCTVSGGGPTGLAGPTGSTGVTGLTGPTGKK